MKHIIAVMTAALVALINLNGAEVHKAWDNNANKDGKDAKAKAKWIDSISVDTVGALKTEEINNESQWGAGVDVGVGINKYVTLHAVSLAYESDNEWRGGAVDESGLLVEAKLTRFS